ncbi:Programmed cell death protein 2, partial [Rhizophlyctis rosea]
MVVHNSVERSLTSIHRTAPLCHICNLHAPKQCSRCKSVRYCSREHQLLDWNQGGHKVLCPTLSSSPASPLPASTKLKFLFKEHELISEEEPEDEDGEEEEEEDGEEEEEGKQGKKEEGGVEGVTKEVGKVKVGEVDEDAEFEETNVVDKAFLKFQKRVDLEPEQIV